MGEQPNTKPEMQVRLLPLPQNFRNMKRESEQRISNAIRMVLQTLERNVADAGIILGEYESTHDDSELCDSRHYNALNAGYFAMKEAIDRINNQLNE
jgi:hypothetical protein